LANGAHLGAFGLDKNLEEFSLRSEEYLLHFIDEKPRWLSQVPSLLEGSVVLDLGAGDGRMSYYIKKGFPRVKIISLDLSFLRCKRCRKNVDALVAQGDAQAIPLRDKTVDFVICNQVIEHVPEEEKLLKEINRVLKMGGLSLISSVVASRYSWFIYKNKYGKRSLHPGHLREYASVAEFQDLLKKWFEVTKLYSYRVRFSLVRHLVRLLYKYRLISRPPLDLFEKNFLLHGLQKLTGVAPGYHTVEVFAKKRFDTSGREHCKG